MTLAEPSVAVKSEASDVQSGRGRIPSVPAWSLVTALVFGLVVYLSSGPIDDPDVWWHVRLGRLILRTHRLPHHETWSYAAKGHAWTPTAWLSDVVYGGLVELGGYRALIMLKLVVCAVAGVMILRLLRRTGSSPGAQAVAFALTFLPLTFFLRERPQAFSLLFVIWLAGRCDLVRRGGTLTAWSSLTVQWLWANVHGMWFLGPAFLVVAAVADVAVTRGEGVARLRRHLLLAVGGVAVAALTPVGPKLVVQPFLVHSAARTISEWLPTVLWQGSLAPYLIAVCVVIVSLARRNRVGWADPLWLIVVVGFSLVASRNVAPAMILLVPAVARAIDDIGALPATLRVPLLAPIIVSITGIGFAIAGTVAEPAISHSEPTRLVRELGALPGSRHVLNDYTIGGLITGLQPAASVSIDGRTDNYSPTYVTRYLGALQLRGHWQRLVASLDPDCALLARGTPIAYVLVTELHWTVVDSEGGYVLLERGSRGTVTLPPTPPEVSAA